MAFIKGRYTPKGIGTYKEPREREMSKKIGMGRVLAQLERLAAWILAALLLSYLISGYGLVKPSLVKRLSLGVLTWERCYALHKNLDVPLIICFVFHISMCLTRTLLKQDLKHKSLAYAIPATLGSLLLGLLLTLSLAEG